MHDLHVGIALAFNPPVHPQAKFLFSWIGVDRHVISLPDEARLSPGEIDHSTNNATVDFIIVVEQVTQRKNHCRRRPRVRSDERRGGKGMVRTWRSRWSPHHQ